MRGSAGRWRPRPETLNYSFVHRESLERDRDEVFRFIWDNRAALDLCDQAFTQVGGVRPCLRVDADGFTLRETVADYVQILTVRADEIETIRIPDTKRRIRRPPGLDDWQTIRILGGGALIFDEFGHLKYHVRNSVLNPKRQSERLAYLARAGFFDRDPARRPRLCRPAHERPEAIASAGEQGETSMAIAPTSLTLRCYGVGFGDCFLLTFHYPGTTGDRHVMIDFGSTQNPPNAKTGLMKLIAKDIAQVVGTRLHVLVATHRHADHINGFSTNAAKTDTGDIIAGLDPQLVVQPWTERPEAPEDFIGTMGSLKGVNDAFRLSLCRE